MRIQPEGVTFIDGLSSDGHAFIDLSYKIGTLANGRKYETELRAYHASESATYVYFGVNYIGQMQQLTGFDGYYKYLYSIAEGTFTITGYLSNKNVPEEKDSYIFTAAKRSWALSSIPTKWTTQTMRLFGFNTTSPSVCRYGCRVYYFKMTDNGKLVRDMVPCEYNGKYGMWDLVEGKFYGNANSTGAFIPVGGRIQVYRAKEVKKVYRKLNGVMKQISAIHRKVSGAMKQIF